jgi:hypothetical protein
VRCHVAEDLPATQQPRERERSRWGWKIPSGHGRQRQHQNFWESPSTEQQHNPQTLCRSNNTNESTAAVPTPLVLARFTTLASLHAHSLTFGLGLFVDVRLLGQTFCCYTTAAAAAAGPSLFPRVNPSSRCADRPAAALALTDTKESASRPPFPRYEYPSLLSPEPLAIQRPPAIPIHFAPPVVR